MSNKYDPQHEAEAAMKRAAASEGPDRQRLIELALAWHQLARGRDSEPSGGSSSDGKPDPFGLYRQS